MNVTVIVKIEKKSGKYEADKNCRSDPIFSRLLGIRWKPVEI